jgi:hypothetical protein
MANVAILTTFTKFDPWYSLTGIVKDQATMLAEYENTVSVFVNERYKDPSFIPGEVEAFESARKKLVDFIPKIPFTHLTDYQPQDESISKEHEAIAESTAAMLVEQCNTLDIDTVFTHDFVFTGWNRPYALGIQKASPKLPKVSWLHWIHSIPTANSCWWRMSDYGLNHKLVYPNRTDIIRVAESFRTNTSSIRVIPHIKDIRVMFDFDMITRNIIDDVPALMQADIVQIYPASSDRFEAKRVKEVMQILAAIKSMGHSVCLFVANQWATTAKHRADIDEYYAHGKKYGLEPGKDLIFSSFLTQFPFKVGIPSKILTQLMMLSNLFVFPTDHETFGLVLPEVSLASGALCVLNRSLHMMQEISGGNTLFFDFGSYTNIHNCPDPDEYLRQVAMIILGRMQENDGIMTRTHMRKTYNTDNLYKKYYLPIMAETRMYIP